MIPTLTFGRTGHVSSRTIFGAAALGQVSQDEADRTMELVLQYGVNHIDTAASYGESELRLGPWMDSHRQQFFLATKTGERTYAAAHDQIHRSLERLRVSQIDLLQLHNLGDLDEWETAMGPGGALEAAIEAKDHGLVRFLGVTGHGVGIASMHLRSLQRYPFDSVLLPYSYIMMRNPQYASDFEGLASLCRQRNVAMQTIKAITRRPWGVSQQNRATWYEPLEDQGALERAVHWVLGRPDVFLNTVGDINLLPAVFEAASRFEHRPANADMKADREQLAMEPLFV